MAEEKEVSGFISRWSRLKREVADTQTAADQDRATTDPITDGEEVEDAEFIANREAAEAVDLDTLDFSSDFSVFMKNGVPLALKNRALRKLWDANPVLANLDGLNDYEQTDVDRTPVTIKSLWQVGKGYAREAENLAASFESAEEPSPEPEEAEASAAESTTDTERG